jgi:ribonuclease P protein component
MDSKRVWPPREDVASCPHGAAKGASGSRPTNGCVRAYASLRGRREFALVLRRGRAVGSKHLVVFALGAQRARDAQRPRRATAPLRAQRSSTRVGIVITKKVGGAVERNRLRRRCKAILDGTPLLQTKMWYVVQFRPSAAQISYAQLREQLTGALVASAKTAGQTSGQREASRV